MNGTIVNKLKTIAGACAILIAASAAQAQDADAEEMTAIIQAIEYGWEHADGAPFRKHFLDFDGGQFAWAVADVEVIAVVKSDGRKIHNRGYETFLFRRIGSEWKVVHTHSSSRPVKVEEPEHKH